MKKCAYINNKSLINLGLIPLKVDIPLPKPKLYYLEIPGANGKLDLTNYMGDMKYENIVITIQFESTLKEYEIKEILKEFNGMYVTLKIETTTSIDEYFGRLFECYVSKDGSISNGYIKIDASPENNHVDI